MLPIPLPVPAAVCKFTSMGFGHRHNRRFLQTKHVLKIFRKILQKRLFRGSRVSEDGGQSESTQEVVRRVVDGHLRFGLLVFAHLFVSL
jgi:hypothetical protein